jgi:hypothetical protein
MSESLQGSNMKDGLWSHNGESYAFPRQNYDWLLFNEQLEAVLTAKLTNYLVKPAIDDCSKNRGKSERVFKAEQIYHMHLSERRS